MMIPFKVKTFSFLLACACSTAGMAQVGNDSPVKQVKISGYVGTRITDCIEHRVKAQDVDHLVEPFRHRKEKSRWQSESIPPYCWPPRPPRNLALMSLRSAEPCWESQWS